MNINRLLKIGDRAKITVDGGSYSTIVEKAADDGGFCIAPPQNRLTMVNLKKDRVYPMSLTVQNGIMVFHVRVDGTDLSDNIPLVRVMAVDEPKRVQRRKCYRADVMLDVVAKKVGDDDIEEAPVYNTRTLNISEDGMLIFSDGRIKVGDLLECDIRLDRFGMDKTLEGVKAVVTRVDDAEDGKQKAAARYVDCTRKNKDLILKFVVYSQRKKKSRE